MLKSLIRAARRTRVKRVTPKLDKQQLSDAAYQVSRGVRPMALAACGLISDLPGNLKWLRKRVDSCGYEGVHSAVLAAKNDTYEVVYAAEAWVIDLYRWANSKDVPDEYGHQVRGLLLGYSPDAITAFLQKDGFVRHPRTKPGKTPILEYSKRL
jgi:hypothetical protein